MRILTLNLLAAALLLFGATSASAFAINAIERNGVTSALPGDQVIVDVFLDADPGLQLLSVGVLYDTPGFTYSAAEQAASAALPVIYPAPTPAFGTTGAQPGYILYTGGKGATILYPQQSPAWLTWPAPPPGQGQVNVNYAEPAFNPAAASGTGIWIASIVFTVDAGGTLALSLTSGGNILQANDVILDPGTVALSAPITISVVPEPTTAALIGLGVLGLAIAGRRRA